MIDGIGRPSSSLSPTGYNRFSASAFNPGVSADSYLPVSNSIFISQFISHPSYSGAIRANAPVALIPFYIFEDKLLFPKTSISEESSFQRFTRMRRQPHRYFNF